MSRTRRGWFALIGAPLVASMGLAACDRNVAPPPPPDAVAAEPEAGAAEPKARESHPEAGVQPVPGYVTDMEAFEAFIATRPTPVQFRARYPDVLLALPHEPHTMELRTNNSRYFAELDAAEERIVGGRFG